MQKLFLLVFCLTGAQHVNSQTIKVYFNQSVNNSISIITDATSSAHLDDTIMALIDLSINNLDIAVWDNGSTKIVNALNAAHNRGVQVRYITSSNSINSALSGLNSAIPVLERNSGLTSNVMHNKFIVCDNRFVLSGSMNFGEGSMFDDYNNILIIDNASLATAYTTEFNEMWGTSGAQPNTSTSLFGPAKSNNTTHFFTIGGSSIESYFSPTDNTTAEIINEINSADFTLDIAMFTFTNNDLGDAVIAAKNRGVLIRCIIENVNYFGSEYNGLVGAGIDVISHQNIPYDFHHKYCIIDGNTNSSNPTVVTGSHNWTNSAEDEYDENTLIIHDLTIAQQYWEEFSQRWLELGGNSVSELDVQNISIFPNPSAGSITIQSPDENLEVIEVLDQAGKQIFSVQPNSGITTFNLPSGLYILRLKTDETTYFQRVSIQ